jgi:hypothetical protein
MKVIHNELLDSKEYPAISIILPTHRNDNRERLEFEYMEKIISRIEERIKIQYSHAKAVLILEKLNEVIRRIDFSKLTEGLAIYVSPKVEKIIHLPFPVLAEKVIVDETFEVRDLIQMLKACRNTLLVVISHNNIKTFTGFECKQSPLGIFDIPNSGKESYNLHTFSGWNYFESHSWEEKNVVNYLHFIDNIIEKELQVSKLDIIVLGDVKLLSFFRKHTDNTEKIIGYIEGNFEHSSISELKKIIQPVIEKENKKEEEYALRLLSDAISKDNYSAGISQVWRAATEGRGRLLIVEKDYRQQARLGDNSYTIFMDDVDGNPWNLIADAVDDIMQKVLKNKGDIVFVENGLLKGYNKIVLINRY